MKKQGSAEHKTKYHTYRFHRYDDNRGGLVNPLEFKDKVKALGYEIEDLGGINWSIYKTNCPEEKCFKIQKQLSK